MSDLTSSILLAAVMISGQGEAPRVESPAGLEARLRREDPAVLAGDARRQGDVRRGALVFYQPALMCARCHVAVGPDAPAPLGPDLATLGKTVAGSALVEAILEPSKTVRQGYETVTIVTDDGRTTTGLLAEDRPDVLIIRDPSNGDRRITIAKARIEERDHRGPSIMPAGLVNALGSRQQFLDLIRYLMEIAEFGPALSRTLRPDPALLAPPLPPYERNLDHAGLIAELGPQAFERGRAIYVRVCANCHGTMDRAGSLPTAPRFAAATLKNGADPYHMYGTLTAGFGQMAAQSWLVPRQKYDLIHYIREAYFKSANTSQYTRVDSAYLDGLPKGTTRGPAPVDVEPWSAMDYGPNLSLTVEEGSDRANIAFKGMAIRLDAGPGGVSRGRAWALYDLDSLRLAAAWTGQGFIDWNGINFNGRHQVHPRIVGTVHARTTGGPGWAKPGDQSFDGAQPYGPLPKPWARLKGYYRHGDQVILAYTVGQTEILESPGFETDPARPEKPVFTRTLAVGPSPDELFMRVASAETAVSLTENAPASLSRDDRFIVLRVPRARSSRLIKVLMSQGPPDKLQAYAKSSPPAAPLAPFTHGGPRRWPEIIATEPVMGGDQGPLAVDILTIPDNNPWHCQMRISGFDFLQGGRQAALCTWDGDVWLVGGLGQGAKQLTWQRIASGLFQPLGLKIVAGRIYVGCRDQIVCLRDFNGDGETDYYETFNSDHQVTDHFHDFAMDLQTDAEGNFYYAKAARHGLPPVVPQHGTLLKVSKDGSTTEIVATGFRAPNGVCLNPDGTFFLSDQEGFWTPKNRINWVKKGGFYGNMWSYYHPSDAADSAMEPPVCWITNAIDRSPAELLWVDSTQAAWKPLRGALLSLSYGNGKIFVVPHEVVKGQMQGGVCALPIPAFPTGIMRGRFNPVDGQLYVGGLFGWAGDRTQPGGFYRARMTGKPLFVPTGLVARRNTVEVTFTGPLDLASAGDPSHYKAKTWTLKRTARYGSDHFDERPAVIQTARVSRDRRTVILEIPDLKPTWCMEIVYAIKAESGTPVEGTIHNTIHHLGD